MLVSIVEFHFVDEFLDVLLFGAGADHQHVVRIDDDVLLQAADHGDLALGQRDDRRARVVEVAPLLGNGVGVTVLARVLVDGAPGPDVAPPELPAADVDVVGLLHDAVVDRDGAALREGDLHDVAFGFGAHGLHHAAEERMVLGEVLLEGLDDRTDLPDEDARIPEEFARLEEYLCQFEVRFFGKALHLADGFRVRDLDVPVPRIGAGGLDAHGHQGVVLRGEVEAFGDDGAEILFVEDQVVRGGDDHLRIGIGLHERVGRIGDARGGIASHGFAQHLPFFEFGDMLQHQPLVFVVGHHEEILRGDDFCKAFVGVADEGFSRSEDVEELLGLRLSALGPEPGADAARHDDTIFIACHELLYGVNFDKDKNIYVTFARKDNSLRINRLVGLLENWVTR